MKLFQKGRDPERKLSGVNLGESDPRFSQSRIGAKSFNYTTPVPLPLIKLQARVSHLQDAKARGKERGKRWHGTRIGFRLEVGEYGRGRRPHCLATIPGHVHW